MSDAKASGLRPPSKIGRPCCTLPPKPAIPPSPPRLSMTESMDHLWDNQRRRLSEAGARRASDTSVVLNEDTDSFIIGDRVWVGGTKPGLIAYIGDTQFAPGEWAGVVLDEPIGKNDGSVAGTRYFQCEPKRGIFSRLTRLTRQPLSDASLFSPKSPTSPTQSTKGALDRTSLNASTTSLSSVSHKDLKLGDRVIVSSNQGSKTGVLRFMGITEFAPGEWCGVELDEPVGKNDGSIDDKRYFECRPKHGLFAPLHKVSRSPSSRKSTMCAIHKPSGPSLTTSQRKLGSRESLASVSSIGTNASTAASVSRVSASSTARRAGLRTSTPARSSLQEATRERQQEIEILRKERDLERDRVTKAASQADQAEQAVVTLRQEYEKYREDMERMVQEAQFAYSKILDEKNSLAMQLEEERRKYEDLLFRFEEESLTRDDIQVTNALNEAKIKDLEKQLMEERERVLRLEQDSTKLFEAEEELTRLRSELSSTTLHEQSVLQELRDRNEVFAKERVALEEELQEKNTSLEQYVAKLKTLEDRLNQNHEEMTSMETSRRVLIEEIEKLKLILEEKSSQIDGMTKEFDAKNSALEEELQRVKEMVKEYTKIAEEKDAMIQKAKELETESAKNLQIRETALEEVKAETTRKIELLTASFQEQLQQKDERITELKTQLENANQQVKRLENELSVLQDSGNDKDGRLEETLKTVGELSTKLKSVEENNISLQDELQQLRGKNEDVIRKASETEQQLKGTLAAIIEESVAKTDELKKEWKLREADLENLHNAKIMEVEELSRRLQDMIKEKDKCLQDLNEKFAQKEIMLKELENVIAARDSVIMKKDEEVGDLLKKNLDIQQKMTLHETSKLELENQAQEYKTVIDDLKKQLETSHDKTVHLTKLREKLESEIADLASSSANSSDQLSKYIEEARRKEKELEEVREQASYAEGKLKTTQGKYQEAEENLRKARATVDQLNSELTESRLRVDEELKLKAELHKKITDQEKENERQLAAIVEKDKIAEEELQRITCELSEATNQLQNAKAEIITSAEKYALLEKSHAEELATLRNQRNDIELQLTSSLKEVEELRNVKAKLEIDRETGEGLIKELNEKVTKEADVQVKLQSELSEKDSRLSGLETRIAELEEERKKLEEAASLLESRYNESLKEVEHLKSNYSSTASEISSRLECSLKEKDQIAAERDELKKSLEESTGTVEELKKKLSDTTEEARLMETKLSEARGLEEQNKLLIADLNNVVEAMKKSRVKLEADLEESQEALKKKLQETEETSSDKCNLENTVKILEAELLASKTESLAKDDTLLKLRQSIEESSTREVEILKEQRSLLEAERKSFQDTCDEMKRQIVELQDENGKSTSKINELCHELKAKEDAMNQLSVKMTTLENSQMETSRSQDEIFKLKKEFEKSLEAKQVEINRVRGEYESLKLAKGSLEKTLEETRTELDVISSAAKSKKTEAEKMVKDLTEKLCLAEQESSRLREAQNSLEKDKQILAELAKPLDNYYLESSSNNAAIQGKGNGVTQNNNEVSIQKLLEENETVKSQVDFLNSVIVDMQRKNEALTCKIEVLEMGVPANEADDYSRSTLDKRAAAPRLFCDICDRFDLHDTEDCPRQEQDFADPAPTTKTKKPPIERPYCENCEMFGHDTLNCDDKETF
ncbi:restin homolog isoform X2 [Orussus abietinus]|uniref:restin homolog isoform X2 n=1 Tax=Orussus abietinus TaxID=222816 RepID=UPI0006260E7A|nr:restin homolog isoform X2 [Orussus abietinus]